MATKPTLDELKRRRDELNKKIREEQSAEAKKARAERTRHLIQLGGLVEIARDITHQTMTAEELLGGLLYAHAAAGNPDKAEMIKNWEDKGRAALIARAKKIPAPPQPGGES